jgi:DNA-binding CsgD family transcriptional regulator
MEAEVAILLAKGSSPRKISERLGISVHTVRTHLYHCFDKFGVSRQAELVSAVLRSPVDDG